MSSLPLDGQPLDHPDAVFEEDHPWDVEDARIAHETEREARKADRDLAQADADQILADYLLLRDEAERGDAAAQFDFGLACVKDGDVNEALTWFRCSAEQEYALAQFAMGLAYELGIGGTEDRAKAIRWYRLAAKQGDEDAEEGLRRLGA